MTNGKTFTVTEQLNSEEDFDALQEVTADLEQAEARIEELEGKLSKSEALLAKATEALCLADAALSGANMNMRVVEKSIKSTLAELSSVSCANLKGQDDE